MMFFKRYDFGETSVYYAETPVEGHPKKTTVGMAIYPKEIAVDPAKLCLDGMVQVALSGDETLVDYTQGVTMRNHSSTLLKVTRQVQLSNGSVNTYLADGNGNEYLHRLAYSPETGVFSISVRYDNRSRETRVLEHLASFSVSGLAGADGTATDLSLCRMTSAWSRECRIRRDSLMHLGLDMSWARYGVKAERFGQVGSMPNRGYYPFAALEDGTREICWGVQLEAPYSWQIELYREKESCALSGGLGDYEFAHWQKRIPAGGSFETHRAFFTVKRNFYDVCNALVREQDSRLSLPACEKGMPILYNEYCTTWGSPSDRNVSRLLRALKTLPVDYFVMDCGWYKPDDKGWCNAIGDWRESAKLFPEGIGATVDKIKAAGKRAGIWFEFEVAGRDSDCFSREELLLKRDGKLITSKNRRFLDLRLPETRDYLNEKLLTFLKEKGFGYLKIDYNDTYGVGCDDEDSVGEGGRSVAEESILWLDRLKDAIPDLVIENCSSGGSRIEPLRMSKVSMCSFSDAHECNEIPLVAANVSLVVPARQSQIWAVIRAEESDARTVYSLCAAMMGRICLSGDIHKVSKEKLALIGEGLAFYRKIAKIVESGRIRLIDCDVVSYRKPRGRQVYVKDFGGERLVLVHFLECASNLHIPLVGYRVEEAFTDLTYTEEGDELCIRGENYHAGAFRLVREEHS